MADTRAKSDEKGWVVFSLLVIWLISYFAVRGLLESNPAMSSSTRLALSFLPTPIFAVFLWRFIRAIRGADELERRIQLESLAVAFPLGLLLLSTLGLVQRAVTLNFENWSYNHVWPMFIILYFIGVIVARRRYT
jgi:hypothetical protein